MEALVIIGIIANFAGIISLTIQIAEVLGKEIDNARSADQRVQHIAVELRAIAYVLTKLQTLSDEDLKISNDRLFTDEDRLNIDSIVQRCDKIFRQISVSFSRMGRVVLLDAVDGLQPGTQSGGISVIPYKTPTFEFSIRGRLMWHSESRKILQSIADLDQLKVSLTLIIAAAGLARQNRRRQKETGKAAWKRWKWVGPLRQRMETFRIGPPPTDQSTTPSVEAKQQTVCRSSAAGQGPFAPLWRQEKRGPRLCVQG